MVVKHRNSLLKSLCPVVIWPYLCSSDLRARDQGLPGGLVAMERDAGSALLQCEDAQHVDVLWMALLVQRYLSNAASFVLCVFCRVKEHHTALHSSPLFCRQPALDKQC